MKTLPTSRRHFVARPGVFTALKDGSRTWLPSYMINRVEVKIGALVCIGEIGTGRTLLLYVNEIACGHEYVNYLVAGTMITGFRKPNFVEKINLIYNYGLRITKSFPI